MAQFAVKSENHGLGMLPVMENLKTVGCFVDVSLVCEGRTIKAHKLVLASGSPFFRQIFLENPCQHPVIILQDIKYPILKEIIDFLYKGELVMPTSDLQTFLKTVKTLDVKNLVDICNEEFLQSRVSDTVEIVYRDEDMKSTPKKKIAKTVSKQNSPPKDEKCVDKAMESAGICLSPNSLEKLGFCPAGQEETELQRESQEQAVEEGNSHDEKETEDKVAAEQLEEELNDDSDASYQPYQKKTRAPQILFLSETRKLSNEAADKKTSCKRHCHHPKQKRSGVWKFFEVVDECYAKCNACHSDISYRGSVTNLAKHLKRRHPAIN